MDLISFLVFLIHLPIISFGFVGALVKANFNVLLKEKLGGYDSYC